MNWKHCDKRRNCSFWAISSIFSDFSKEVCCRGKWNIWKNLNTFQHETLRNGMHLQQTTFKNIFAKGETSHISINSSFVTMNSTHVQYMNWLSLIDFFHILIRCLQSRMLQASRMWKSDKGAEFQIIDSIVKVFKLFKSCLEI